MKLISAPLRTRLSLILILCVALITWLMGAGVYMQDELSALSRLEFPDFQSLLNEGVRPDGHPAFVQVFLYLWTGLFGRTEWIVKLPSILCGLGSIYLAHRLSLRFYGRHVAAMVGIMVALSQYYVLYFTLARPYSYGTFFVLCQVFSLLQWKSSPNSKHRLLFILSSVLCAYAHYFAMLTSGLVALWGFVWLEKKELRLYALSLVAAMVLFLPHLGITLHQLSIGGVGGPEGWLAPPDTRFLGSYFSYFAQYSWVTEAILLISVVFSVYNYKNLDKDSRSFFFLGILLFFVPFFIGFFYSIYVNPVLQYSVLIFGSIPLLMSLFSGWRSIWTPIRMAILLLLTCSTLYGLTIEREHFKIISQQPFDRLAHEIEQSEEPPLVLGYMNPRFIGQYDYFKDLDYRYYQFYESPIQTILDSIRAYDGPVLVYPNRSFELVPMIVDEFGSNVNWIRESNLNILAINKHQPFNQPPILERLRSESHLKRSESEEFGVAIETSLSSISGFPDLQLFLSQDFTGEKSPQAVLVSEIWHGDSLLHWNGRTMEGYGIRTSSGFRIYSAQDLNDIIGQSSKYDELTWKAYIWNRGFENLEGGPISIQVASLPKGRNPLFLELKQ